MGRKGKRGIRRGRGKIKGGEGTKEEERDNKERGIEVVDMKRGGIVGRGRGREKAREEEK